MKFELDPDRHNISDEVLLRDLADVAGRLHTPSPTAAQYGKNGQFDPSTVMRRFGGWRAALSKAGLQPGGLSDVKLDIDRRNVPDQALLDDLKAVATHLRTDSPTRADYQQHGQFHPSTINRRFGNWHRALVKARLLPAHNNAGVDSQEALSDLRAVATKLGRSTVTNSAYCTHGRYSDGPLIRAFGSWNGALQAAGLDVSKRARIPDDELFENLERIWRAIGRQPKYGEVTKPLSAFSTGTYESRFGSWRKALEAFVSHTGGEMVPAPRRIVAPDPPQPTAAPARRPSRAINWRLRFLVMQRDGFSCRSCGASPAKGNPVSLHIDHVIPWSKGGETEVGNLQTLCEVCNIGKGDLGPNDA